MSSEGSTSVSEWLTSVKRGDAAAAQKLFERYYQRLLRAAERRLGSLPRRIGDGEDVAQEALASFFEAVESNRFPQLADRDDLWQVLLMLIDRRACDQIRRDFTAARGGGKVAGESAIRAGADSNRDGIANVECREATPETADGLVAFLRECSKIFDDVLLTKIATDKLQGYNNQEIADRTKVSMRSVERKLSLIRRILTES